MDRDLNRIDAEGGAMVKPDPGFVIKTQIVGRADLSAVEKNKHLREQKKSGSPQKLFINVCSNELIERPHQQTILPDDPHAGQDDQEGLRIPVSVGPVVQDRDQKGEECLVLI